MHINDIQHFEIAKSCILVNNMIMLNMNQNTHAVVKLWRFQEFYIKPRPLINMHDIIMKNNWAHLRTVGYLCTTYDINPMCSLEISCLQALFGKITLSPTHYAY